MVFGRKLTKEEKAKKKELHEQTKAKVFSIVVPSLIAILVFVFVILYFKAANRAIQAAEEL